MGLGEWNEREWDNLRRMGKLWKIKIGMTLGSSIIIVGQPWTNGTTLRERDNLKKTCMKHDEMQPALDSV